MEIRDEDYRVVYDEASAAVSCEGLMRLRGAEEYAPITDLLDRVKDQAPATITLDVQNLRFLNSSGINVLFKFVIDVRELGKSDLVVLGSSEIPWQGKSLKNLQRLMPTLRLKLT